MSKGRFPTLHTSGGYLLSVGLLLLVLGVAVGQWSVSALGLSALALLCASYVGFALRVSLLWRRHLELLWWLPKAASSEGLVAHRPVEVQLTLRNLSPLRLSVSELRIFASRCVVSRSKVALLDLPPHSEAAAQLDLLVTQAGEWFIHGATVRLCDRLGLYTLEAYFPSALKLKVLPRQQPSVVLDVARSPVGVSEQRIGVHSLRQRGLGGDLRELRDYVPGDPFKLIAWKATARSPNGRLLVKELERETLRVHYLLLDMSVTMREGVPGQWKLDHALELCQSYARSVLAGSDRLGFVAFDGDIYQHIIAGDGPVLRRRLTEKLLSVMHVVEPSFVAMTDGELFAAVARYLRQQEAIETRLASPPPHSDAAAWAQIAVAPSGERISRTQVVQAVRRLLKEETRRGNVQPSDEELLRLFCRERGIELPYGQRAAAERGRGLARALELAATMPGAQVVLISDLLGLSLDEPKLLQAISLCRRRGLGLLCVRPEARSYLPKSLLHDEEGARAASIFSWETERYEASAHKAIAMLGFQVIPVGPEDGFAQILSRRHGRPVNRRASSGEEASAQRPLTAAMKP